MVPSVLTREAVWSGRLLCSRAPISADLGGRVLPSVLTREAVWSCWLLYSRVPISADPGRPCGTL